MRYNAFFTSSTLPILTLFTTFSNNSERLQIESDTVKNWSWLGSQVRRLNFYVSSSNTLKTEDSLWRNIEATKLRHGLPVIKDLFLDAENVSKTQFHGYANGDILFTDSLLCTLKAVYNNHMRISQEQMRPFLMVGRRTNVSKGIIGENVTSKKHLENLKNIGQLAPRNAIDYFITHSTNFPWEKLEDVVVARIDWDNYVMI